MTAQRTSMEVVKDLEELIGVNQQNAMEVIIDVEARIKNHEIYRGRVDFTKSHFDQAGYHMFMAFLDYYDERIEGFWFTEEDKERIYSRVDTAYFGKQ